MKLDFLSEAGEGDDKLLLVRSGYLALGGYAPEWVDKVNYWLAKGQVRSALADDDGPFPDLIEVGEQVPAGTNPALGRRILFMTEYYQGHLVFRLPQFIANVKPTCWVPLHTAADNSAAAKPLYQDEQFAGFDVPVEGAEMFGYLWPAQYYQFKTPKARY
jgi:hypothetical protein